MSSWGGVSLAGTSYVAFCGTGVRPVTCDNSMVRGDCCASPIKRSVGAIEFIATVGFGITGFATIKSSAIHAAPLYQAPCLS
jgi:hypothetical protein